MIGEGLIHYKNHSKIKQACFHRDEFRKLYRMPRMQNLFSKVPPKGTKKIHVF